jgi:uncharacterized delta-60 repeat protein
MLDPTFGTGGRVTTPVIGALTSTAVDSQGRIIVGGYMQIGAYDDFAVARYSTAGTLDTSFGATGVVTIDFGNESRAVGVALDSLGRIVVAGIVANGTTSDFAVARLTAAGALDPSFDNDGKQTIDFAGAQDRAGAVTIDSLDRIVVAGGTYNGSNSNFAVARLTAAGALDANFDGDGKQTIAFGALGSDANGVAVDSQDRVVFAGTTSNGSNTDFAVVRLTAAGALDASFDGDGKQTINFGLVDQANGVAIDSLDRVLVAGWKYDPPNGSYDFAVARLTVAGAPDASFDGDGKQTIDFGSDHIEEAYGVAVDSRDRVVVAGGAEYPLSLLDFAVARLTSAGTLDSNFDGDGKQTIDFGSDDEASSVAIASGDRVVLVGQRFVLARLTGDTTTAAAQVNDGSVQRSRVTSLTVRFSSQVTFSGAAADAFSLVRIGGGAVNFVANATVVNGGTVVTLNGFSGPETEFGSLRDGRYTLTALASQISAGGQTLDGDADGTPGGDYVSPPDTYLGNGLRLYRLFGDANGDGVVDPVDLNQFRMAFNSISGSPFYLAFLDADHDGVVDAFDLDQFRSRFNVNVF